MSRTHIINELFPDPGQKDLRDAVKKMLTNPTQHYKITGIVLTDLKLTSPTGSTHTLIINNDKVRLESEAVIPTFRKEEA